MSNDLTTRVRVTIATATRNQNLRDILDALKAGPMLFDEVAAVLGFSESGTRKYCRDLVNCGAVKVSRSTTIINYSAKSDSRYSLTDDDAKLAEFMAMLDKGQAPDRTYSQKVLKRAAARDALMPAGRHVYTQGEDLERLIARQVRIPAPDPLLAMFYNMGAA